jgi:hypothetical protein
MSGIGNSYAISHSGVSHAAVETIIQNLQQFSSLPNSGNKRSSTRNVPTGKSLLSQLRTMCFYLSIFRPMISPHVKSGLFEILRHLSDSDVDRKIFRTALYLLSYILENNTNSSSNSVTSQDNYKVDPLDEQFYQYLITEVRNQNATTLTLKLATVTRMSGIMAAVLKNRKLTTSNDLLKSLLMNYFPLIHEIPSLAQAKKNSVSNAHTTLNILTSITASFSALRRMNESLSLEHQSPLEDVLRHGSLSMHRHLFALVLNTIQHITDSTLFIAWAKWLSMVLKDTNMNIPILKDLFASSYLIRIVTILSIKTEDNARWPKEIIELMIDTINLVEQAR